MEEESRLEKLHPGHHSIRLKEYDYSSPGFYFVTICTHEKKCALGSVHEGRVALSKLGKAVRECWLAIPRHFAGVNLHAFEIMPIHVRGVVEIVGVGAQHAAPLLGTNSDSKNCASVKAESLGTIVRSFKAAVTRLARRELAWNGEVWQRNYFERILRDGQEIVEASRYIEENPMLWELDRENPGRKKP